MNDAQIEHLLESLVDDLRSKRACLIGVTATLLEFQLERYIGEKSVNGEYFGKPFNMVLYHTLLLEKQDSTTHESENGRSL